MNLFEIVKQTVSTRQAAESFGVSVSRNGMALCPFHEDSNPSLLLDERYYCFGCHATGDVIDFTARLLGISKQESAKKLAEKFGEFPRPPTQVNIPSPEQVRNIERFCICVFRDYLRLLRIWKLRFAPESPEGSYDDRFVESCQMTATVDHLLDVLLDADGERRKRAVEILTKDGLIYDLQTYVTKKKQEEMLIGKEEKFCA